VRVVVYVCVSLGLIVPETSGVPYSKTQRIPKKRTCKFLESAFSLNFLQNVLERSLQIVFLKDVLFP
jgi:hypothetical protein